MCRRRSSTGSCARNAGGGAALTYKFQGRDHRLTEVHGEVVNEILASGSQTELTEFYRILPE